MKKGLYIILFFISLTIQAQNEQYPNSVKWFKIDTKFGEIIYPKSIEKDAIRIAKLLEAEQKVMCVGMQTKIKKTSILLNNQLANSNGYVGLAPYKSVWYNTPPQSSFNGSLDWYETLAKHEFRHIYQFNRLNKNLSKSLYFLFGEYGQSAASGMIPNWFFEGDAVLSETLLSKSGRGRVAEFDMPIRTNFLSGINYNYYKISQGSYKDYVANHYHYGYLYTSYLRRQLGAEKVDEVLEHTTKRIFWPFAFNLGLKKYTGSNWSENYKKMIADVGQEWTQRQNALDTSTYTIINTQKKKNYTSYSEPNYLNDSSIVCKKSSRSTPTCWIQIDTNGKETTLALCSTSENYSLWDNKLFFVEQIPDIRWGEKSYSDVMEFDILTKIKKRISFKQRYFSPSLSPDSTKIAVVELNDKNEASICILNKTTGLQIIRFQVLENEMIKNPVWENDSTLILLHGKTAGFGVSRYSSKGILKDRIINYSNHIITQLAVKDAFLTYHSDETGIDNIFCIDLKKNNKFQITSASFGAFNAKINNEKNKLIYQNYTAKGFNLAEISLDSSKWIKEADIKKYPVFYFEPLLKEANESDIKIDSTTVFTPKKYKSFLNSINIHTWYAYALDANVYIGLMSENKLNTLSINPYITYNLNEKSLFGTVNLKFSKFFVPFTSKLAHGERVVSIVGASGKSNSHSFNENEYQVGIEVPLNLSRDVFYRNLTSKISTTIQDRKLVDKELSKYSSLANGRLSYLSTSIIFSNTRISAPKDLQPVLGQSIQIYTINSLQNSAFKTSLFNVSSTFYFPGFIPNHHISLKLDYEQQTGNYFSSQLQVRGYTIDYICQDKRRIGADYAFPIAYPDFAIGQYAYLRRIAAKVFTDFGKTNYPVNNLNTNTQSIKSKDLVSTGLELMFSFHLLNFPYPIHTGLRASYRYLDKQMAYEILPISIGF